MEIEGTEVKILDSNCKAKLKKTKNGKIQLKLECRCGKSSASFEIDNPKPILTERLFEAINANKEGKREPLPTVRTRSFPFQCGFCGRQNTATIQFKLSNKYVKRVMESLNKAELKETYKDLITIETNVKGAHVSREFADARDLLFITCGKCLRKIQLQEATEYFNQITDRDYILSMLESEDYPEPRKFEIDLKCPFCQNKIRGFCKISIKKPETAKEIINIYKKWSPQPAITSTHSTPEKTEEETIRTVKV